MGDAVLVVRPERMVLGMEGLAGVVAGLSYDGADTMLRVGLADGSVVRVRCASHGGVPGVGETVLVSVPAEAVWVVTR